MTELSLEVGAVLSYANINPFDIDRILAGYAFIPQHGHDWGKNKSGLILRMKSGVFRYITLSRDTMFYSVYSRGFQEYPDWLLEDRAVPWSTNEEELNANLPQAKSEAKNGVSAGTFGTPVSRPLVRFKAG